MQRSLSDLLNLFFHNPEEPERLWPWTSILSMLLLCAAIVALLVYAG